MRRIALLAAACTLPGALAAQTSAPAPASTAASPDADKKVCRREEVIGSIMPVHVCRTKAEWMQIDEVNQRTSQTYSDQRRTASGAIGPNKNGG